MKINTLRSNLDVVGITASILCAIHCLGLPFIVAIFPLSGLVILDNPMIELSFIFLSFILAIAALSHGYFKHHLKTGPVLTVSIGFIFIAAGQLVEFAKWWEIGFTSSGAMVVALAHYFNWRLIKKSRVRFPECGEN